LRRLGKGVVVQRGWVFVVVDGRERMPFLSSYLMPSKQSYRYRGSCEWACSEWNPSLALEYKEIESVEWWARRKITDRMYEFCWDLVPSVRALSWSRRLSRLSIGW
jgi:hypothetical protein